jgi:uncharacterized protein YndB with AHSA1/START domain
VSSRSCFAERDDTPDDAARSGGTVRPVTGIDATAGDVYRLGHRWLINGPIDVVFDLLSHAGDYPTWWTPCFKSAEADDEVAVGARSHLRVRARLPYELVWDITVTELDPPNLIEVDTRVRLSGRFPLRGPIRYTLTERPDGVEVINDQVIVSERRLPWPLRAVLQRAFAYNHDWAFRIGGRGLQRAVDQVVAARGAAPARAPARQETA